MIDTVRVVDGRWGIVFQAGEWRALGLLHVIGAAGEGGASGGGGYGIIILLGSLRGHTEFLLDTVYHAA